MPNRIIKESICTSDNVDQLTPFEENVFVRLIVNCDDFGRMDGREKILVSRLFPLKTLKPGQLTSAVKSLVKADLVTVYEVSGLILHGRPPSADRSVPQSVRRCGKCP